MKPLNLLLILTIASLLNFSCKKSHNNPGKPIRYITENDTFNTDVIWYADTIYVIRKSPEINEKLTIRPGTIIKLDLTTGLAGTSIFAIGTKDQPIIFTSIYDDKYGGDIDGDNGAIKPQTGDWLYIGSATASMQIRFEFCEFYYGGAVLALTQYSQKIENCTFAHCNGCLGFPIPSALISLSADPSTTILSKNLFYDNTQPLTIYPGIPIDSTNTFSYQGIGNKQNGIFIHRKELKLSSHLDWKENEVPFVVQDDITIQEGGQLEFINGTILKLASDVQISTTLHNSSLNGTGKKVVYTSIRDDVNGGDTNGDGNATTPHDDDWEGIYSGFTWETGVNILYDNH